MPDRVILMIGTKKGLFVAEAAKSRGKFALIASQVPSVRRQGVPRQSTLDGQMVEVRLERTKQVTRRLNS